MVRMNPFTTGARPPSRPDATGPACTSNQPGLGRITPVRLMLGLITVVLGVWALRATYVVFVPIVFAILLSVVTLPVQQWMERFVPRWVSVLGVLAIIAAALIGLGTLFWLSASQIAQRGQEYASRFEAMGQAIAAWAQQRGFALPIEAIQGDAFIARGVSWLTAGITSIWTVGALAVFTIFLLALMLLEAPRWRQKNREIFASDTAREVRKTCDEIMHSLRHYLVTHSIVSAISGVLQGGWCLVLGIDFALLWGLLTFFLNYLPNIGSLISFLPPTLMALVQYDWTWALLTFACLAVTDVVMGNVVSPLVEGRSLRLSPVVILASVLFWGWAWGVAGAVLSVPITASLVIICLHVRGLQPIGRLLSEPCGKR